MFKIIIWVFVIYLIYRFVTEFVIPVGKATSQVKDQVRRMQEEQQRAYQQQKAQQQQHEQAQQAKTTVSKEDYIDFEEVK